MNIKKIVKVINCKAGYQIRHELIDGKEFGTDDMILKSAYTPNGDYIGNSKTAHLLCKKRGIKPEKRTPKNNVCSIGFCEKEQKWYGWSHRALYGFKVGDKVKRGDCCASSGFTEDYLKKHPEEDKSLPIGFKAMSLEDCKKMAIAFAESVS